MSRFDSHIQVIKNDALTAVCNYALEGKLMHSLHDIPKEIMPKGSTSARCCIYKGRAILSERVGLALTRKGDYDHVIEVIDIACDDCPESGFTINENCRGCLAHRCIEVCPRDAITIVNKKAVIDKSKCVECGKCQTACPFSAVTNRVRPCEQACKIGAISKSPTGEAQIDRDKCISCGACAYQCPFGAISDRSFLTETIELLEYQKQHGDRPVYALVAPTIASQCTEHSLAQVIAGIKACGFHAVIEAALGADIVADMESKEWAEKGFLTNSCCPAYVDYIDRFFPDMKQHVSHNPSPMVVMGRILKDKHPECKVVFIGPCTAKKMEFQKPEWADAIDNVITFEELQALFDAYQLDFDQLDDGELNQASYFGRMFARSGGLTTALQQAMRENHLDASNLKPLVCDGIEECRVALLKASKGVLKENFIEGMACVSGCLGGAGVVTHGPKERAQIDRYAAQAMEKTIHQVIRIFD